MRSKRLALFSIAVALATCLIAYFVLLRDTPSPADRMIKPVPGITPPPLREPLRSDTIFHLTNKIRIENGLHELTGNQILNTISDKRARDMFTRQYFAHVSPTGEQPSDVAQKSGYKYKIVAENIATGYFCTNQDVIDGWMQSPGHRKNVLSNDVTELGTAIVKGRLNGRDTWIAVQTFGLPLPESPQCQEPSRDLANEIKEKRIETDQLHETLKRRREELDKERAFIEEERNSASPRTANNSRLFNQRVTFYNQQSTQYNADLTELKYMLGVLQSRIVEYNDMVQMYNSCSNSNGSLTWRVNKD